MKMGRKIIVFGLFAPIIFSCTSGPMTEEQIEKKAHKIHDGVLTVDTHTDTPSLFLREGWDVGEEHDSRTDRSKVDFPRMKEGGLDAIFFAVFVGQGPRNVEGYERAKTRAITLFDAIHRAVETNPDIAELALSPEDAYRIEKSGKRSVFIGIENGYPLGRDLSLIRKYYDLGARYITLCHSSNNDICDSSTDRNGPEHEGLSEFGEQVVKEMNRLGILVDVSHMSDASFFDVLRVSKAPVFASHSCARAICNHPRNLSDEMLRSLAETGGVLQMCILSSYVKTTPPNPERRAAFRELRQKFRHYDQLTDAERQEARAAWMALEEKYPQELATVSDVVDHIDHIVEVAGIDHVGIGTDFDGGGGVADCYDVSEMGNITRELVKRGYTKSEIRKIWGGNTMRILIEAKRVSASLQDSE